MLLKIKNILAIALFINIISINEVKADSLTALIGNYSYIPQYDLQQIKCMADNAYHEARNQNVKGIIAVNNVVMNRIRHGAYPRTPCEVIRQRRNGVCQFSWMCGGYKPINDIVSYNRCYHIAMQVYYNRVQDVTYGAVKFHTSNVLPKWARYSTRTAKIGDHIFYKG